MQGNKKTLNFDSMMTFTFDQNKRFCEQYLLLVLSEMHTHQKEIFAALSSKGILKILFSQAISTVKHS